MQQRKLDKKRYVYFWADGVYFNIRGDEARQCILVIIGVDSHGTKILLPSEMATGSQNSAG
jgi:transposase-like protein